MLIMATPEQDLDCAVSHALQRLGCATMTLKPEQRASVKCVYEGKDVFLWLPTGFGKSLCYELLPFMFDVKLARVDSLVIVVSPLVSLMTDQALSLRSRGVKAAIMSSLSGVEKDLAATAEDLSKNSLLFCAPEAIVCGRWREALEKPELSGRVVAVVIDEAHCVSKWSRDFRPSYGRLHELRALVPKGTPFLACTATVTRSIRQEVIRSLEMVDCEFISTSPDRANIYYEVRPRTEIDTDLKAVICSLKEHKSSAPRVIVYCRSLDMCANLYAHFHYELGDDSYYPSGADKISDNRLFGMFHANTPQYNKDVILKSLMKPDGVVRVVFATVALGMGINLRDVNTVIHYGGPQSIDDYFQESGRGGRSGQPACSIVYWKPVDCKLRKELSTTRDHEVAAVRRYVENETICRRQWLLDYFEPSCASIVKDPKTCCDVCAKNVGPN